MLSDYTKEFKSDLSASIIVFFVAIPLCLGIALASGAPLLAGVISGIVGGIVVGAVSGSRLGVSGPAAGLAVIVFGAIDTLGSWEAFLVAVVLAGVLQIVLGYVRAGFIAYFFPTSVITGMLTGIGILIILKQIPHVLGYDANVMGDDAFIQMTGENTFSAMTHALNALSPAAIVISLISFVLLILWDTVLIKIHRIFQIIQGPIVVVVLGIVMTALMQNGTIGLSLSQEHIVSLPIITTIGELSSHIQVPDFSQLGNIEVYKIAFVLAIVASLETLLSVEATDKLDPHRRITPTNRELKAQGIGNILSGLIGGLPVTQVIVRSSANITFGAKTKLSAIMHGFFLLISVITIGTWLNMIPLASLATVLIMVGYKLTKPSLFKWMYDQGWEQFVPFIVTIVMIIMTDLLTGVLVGLTASIYFTLHHSYRNSYYLKEVITNESGMDVYHLVLAQEVSFFNKASIVETLSNIPKDSKVVIDCSHVKAMAYDVREFIYVYPEQAKTKNIIVETIKFRKPRRHRSS